MGYAEVAVGAPVGRSTFSYSIPSHLDLHPGQAVWVPFGATVAPGVVVELTDEPQVGSTRDILGTLAEIPLLGTRQLALARWIADRYLCPLFDAISPMLPPDFQRKLATYYRRRGDTRGMSLNTEQKKVLHVVGSRDRTEQRELERKFGKERTARVTERLVDAGLLERTRELKKRQVGKRAAAYVWTELEGEDLGRVVEEMRGRGAWKQAAALEYLNRAGTSVPAGRVKKEIGCSQSVVDSLIERGAVAVEQVRTGQDPLRGAGSEPGTPPELTTTQREAWRHMEEDDGKGEPPVFLLFGVTGSGKTELYIRALERVVAAGKKGICLVPEIALTPQTIERFAARFPNRVAVFHSGLRPSEQLEQWYAIREGECDVVVGARSALFAPMADLGLIVIDEEHEWAYKQEDKSPRYHARDVAIELARLHGAQVILGSATPAVETFHMAESGRYRLLELPERVRPGPLPEVELVDLREELKAGNTGQFSRALLSAMGDTLERGEQVLLFLNRRGSATFVRCARCRYVFQCPRCSVALTHHAKEGLLRCHRCHYRMRLPRVCPRCGSGRLRAMGIGTEKVEHELERLFPGVRSLRWDSDVVRAGRRHAELLGEFRNGRAQVLVGTQMVAKGLDIPEVTLVGVVSADMSVNFPDFRATERTFQLLCQVGGRAGRGPKPGKVIIQTYAPENHAIRAASAHDYRDFYRQELSYRREYRYPPFTRMARLLYVHKNQQAARREAERLMKVLEAEKRRRGPEGVELIGPLPGFVQRVRGRYRWQILLRGEDPAELLRDVALPQGWVVDVDPMGML